jgi:hypothetical protein
LLSACIKRPFFLAQIVVEILLVFSTKRLERIAERLSFREPGLASKKNKKNTNYKIGALFKNVIKKYFIASQM